MMSFKPVSHVIFDLDGVLLDTEPIFTEANAKTLAQYNKEFTWEIKRQQMGRTHADAIRVLLEMTDLVDKVSIEEYCQIYDPILDASFHDAKLLPGAERLIRHLHKHNIPIAICTGSSAKNFDLKTTRHKELISLFHHVVPAGTDPDVKFGKPAPDCFLVCASRFNKSPETKSDILVFEDAPNGVEAAIAAGMQVVMVPDPRVAQAEKDKANICLDSLEKFRPEMFGLPPF